MLHPINAKLRPTTDLPPRPNVYFLSDVTLEIPGPDTAVFRARLNGPAGAMAWARAWLSTEIDGTLAEVASESLNTGDFVTLTVKIDDPRTPEIGCISIESAPLATKHVVIIKLPSQTVAPQGV